MLEGKSSSPCRATWSFRTRSWPKRLDALIRECEGSPPETRLVVGKAGFEPATSASRTLRAAKLRHFPFYGPVWGRR